MTGACSTQMADLDRTTISYRDIVWKGVTRLVTMLNHIHHAIACMSILPPCIPDGCEWVCIYDETTIFAS